MTAPTWVGRWVWPAGGSGGIPGDVLGSLVWAVIAAAVALIVWPALRHRLEAWAHRVLRHHHGQLGDELRELRRRIDHVIEHHPDIPPIEEPTRDDPPAR